MIRAMLRGLRDWSRLLRPVYNPHIKRHEPVHVLGCASCGRASADIREDEHGHDGWTVAPVYICPDCNEKTQLPDEHVYPDELKSVRRKKFEKQIDQIKSQIRTGGKP